MIINANALNIPLADKSIHMICTSPPYWGLRNYGVSGQLGLERTPEEYIANMVAVFRECWRVLRDDGTLWLNIGDSYNGSGGAGGDYAEGGLKDGQPKYPGRDIGTLKHKDLVGIPWRLAFALQADGWYLRSDIIWNKPNPMPESVTDRPTKSHEYLFLLTKRERYYYDAEAIREPHELPVWSHLATGIGNGINNTDRNDSEKTRMGGNPAGRNRRSVWTIPTAPYKGAHFATFPPALVEPCIKAGTSERGCCPKCGKGWRRVVEKTKYKPEIVEEGARFVDESRGDKTRKLSGKEFNQSVKMIGESWQPACTCNAGESIPCLVFDPFVGSGTTVKVAYDLGRRGVGLDLSLEYLDGQARNRIHNGHVGRLV